METEGFKSPKTRKLRLKPLLPSDLPSHSQLASLQSAGKQIDIQAFIREVLTEAVDFTDSLLHETFQKKGSPKSSPPSTAQVQLLQSDLMKGETWFARHSTHVNAAQQGTANYAEFEEALLREHSVKEAEYTPDIFDHHKVMDWSAEIAGFGGRLGSEYEQVVMELYEMLHDLPAPLEHRAFSTLVVSAKTGADSFVVAQVPVDISKVQTAMYSNGRHRTEADSAQKKAKVVQGKYVSVERVKNLPEGISWEMATASDAGGWLPMPMQKMGVPGAIVKDVGFVMKWASERRKTVS